MLEPRRQRTPPPLSMRTHALPLFKVKTVGARTAGVLDVSNLNAVTSPDGRYELAYAISGIRRLGEMAIDGVGLAPDVYLDASVPRWR